MKAQEIKSTLFQYLMRVCVLLAGISFMGDGCKDPASVEQETENKLLGRWKLTKSRTLSDSIYIGTSWIEFKNTNSFNSNTSFFWEESTSKSRSLYGSYSIHQETDPLLLSRHECCDTYILLEADSVAHSWIFNIDSLKMYWSLDYAPINYTWTKM